MKRCEFRFDRGRNIRAKNKRAPLYPITTCRKDESRIPVEVRSPMKLFKKTGRSVTMGQNSPISLGPRWGGCFEGFLGLWFIGGGALALGLFHSVAHHSAVYQRLFISILPIVCVLVGVLLLYRGIHYTRRWAAIPNPKSDSLRGTEHVSPNLSAELGPVTLQPETSRGLKFVVTAALCVTLNGFAISGYLSDGTVMIPLVLGGLLMVAPAAYNGLALFNPAVNIKLSTHPIQVGGLVEISWQVEGLVGRLRRLTIAIEAEEMARQTGAEAPPPESSPFYHQVVVDTSDPTEIRSGCCRFEIPAAIPPTLNTGNNEIAWRVRVRGKIPWTADVQDSFTFTVVG